MFPTSKSSQLSTYIATSVGLAARQRIKLLGGASPGLQSLTLWLGESWRHDFNKTNVPVNSSLTPSQTGSGDPLLTSDQISKWLLVTDRLSTNAGAILPLYKGLELSFGFSYLLTFKPKPTGGCVQTLTGCVESTEVSSATTHLSYTDIDIELAYRPIPELVIGLGYETFRSTTAENGTRADPFYAPGGSTFYTDVAFFPAEIRKRFVKPRAPAEPAVD